MGFLNKTNQIISYTVSKNFSGNVAISIVDGEVAISVPWYLTNKRINFPSKRSTPDEPDID